MKTKNIRQKSDDGWIKPKKKRKILPDIELPKEAIAKASAKITEDAKGLLLVRIPRKIEQLGRITKNDLFEFEVRKELPSKKTTISIKLKREN